MERRRKHWYTSVVSIALVMAMIVTSVMLMPATITKAAQSEMNHNILACKTWTRKPAKKVKIKNKIKTLEVGKTYDFNVSFTPWHANEQVTWSSSDPSIASPDTNGKIVALKVGTVTITCKSKKGASDSVTFTVLQRDGVVANQKQLEELLKLGVSEITIKTDDGVNIEIPHGKYSRQKLVIDAKNSIITNNATFSCIEVRQSKSYVEKAKDNKLMISALDTNLVIEHSSKPTIYINKNLANVKITNNGTVKKVVIQKEARVEILGSSKAKIPVEVNSLNVTIKTQLPLSLSCNEKVNLEILPGAEKTSIQVHKKDAIPTITGNVMIKVKILSWFKVSYETVVGTTVMAEFTDYNQNAIVKEMGAGWNLGNQMEAVVNQIPGETNWGNPVITEALIKSVKAAGFKTIRIPVSYFNYIGAAPNYTVHETWLNRVQEVVDYCIKNDLYVVINMHGDGTKADGGWLLCDGANQENIRAKYQAVWKQIATRFKDYDEHLIFESMDEVFDGSNNAPSAATYANINAYNQIFVDTVRQTGGYNSMRWLLIPGYNANIDYTTGDYGFVVPKDNYIAKKVPQGEKRIMISVHYYAPWEFTKGETGDITQWGESSANIGKVSTHSGQSHMASQFRLLFNSFTSKGYPVVIGEYGSNDKTSYDSSNTYYRAYYARKVCENSIKYGCIPMIWDNGYNGQYGFGLFNRLNNAVTQPDIIRAIMGAFNTNQQTGTSTGISLNQKELTITVGDEAITLIASLAPSNSTDHITWTSSDETIATISDRGVVRAQAVGSIIITASANGRIAQCIVHVKAPQSAPK